jgi:hypothetical protein
MNTAATAMKHARTRRAPVTYTDRVLGSSSSRELRVIVNQPLNRVYAHLANARVGEALSTTGETALCRIDTVLGRRVEISHVLYEIPGGTQVSAGAEIASSEIHDLVAVLAVNAARRQLAADLAELKNRLE